MRKIKPILPAVLLIVFMSVTGASAAWYSDNFPSGGSELTGVSFLAGDEIGPFDAVGDMVSQTFTDTGLVSVNGLFLNIVVEQNTPGEQVVLDILLNGNKVGEWLQAGTGPREIEEAFFDIFGNNGDDYTIGLRVTAGKLSENGSLVLGYPTPMTLFGCACICPVPLPGAVWLLGIGLVGLLGIRRKLRG